MAYPRTHNLFGSHFGGIEMRQYWSDLALWELFLNAHQDIAAVIELGAFKGGLTLFLGAQTLARGQEFYSFDKDRPEAMDTPLWGTLGIVFLLGDFWNDRHKALLDLLHDPALKPLLLFVDGGCKREEFKVFVPELSLGDYAAVHDYGTEFTPGDEDVIADRIELEMWDECIGPPQPCLTRFWKVK
jgi:hypothetical protein